MTHDVTAHDEFRDLIEGRLDALAAARLRARIDSDPALKTEFDAFAAVHALTGPALVPAPVCGLTFEKLDAARRAGRVRRLRPWAAAAAALLVVASGVAAWQRLTPHEVRLRAIALHVPAASAAPTRERVPAALAGYRPVADGTVRWIDSLETGRAVARATNRPLLLWIYHPSCPICVDWDRDAFRDPEVEAKAAEFVPVRLDVMTAGEVAEKYLTADWPYLGVMTADEGFRVDFAGTQGKEQIRKHLADALAAQAKLGAAVAWDVAGDLASADVRADGARDRGDLAAAWRDYESVRSKAPDGIFGRAAKAGLADIARTASAALLDARSLAATDEAAGARRLSEAVERFRGTPYGIDLAEVEKELRATGRFPELVEAARDANTTK